MKVGTVKELEYPCEPLPLLNEVESLYIRKMALSNEGQAIYFTVGDLVRAQTRKRLKIICTHDEKGRHIFVFSSHNLGKGDTGAVILAQELFDEDQMLEGRSNLVVVKISNDKNKVEFLDNEAKVLKKLDRFRGEYTRTTSKSERHNETRYLFSDYCPGMLLFDILYYKVNDKYVKRELNPDLIIQIAEAILTAVESFHSEYGFLHRDLNPLNIKIESKDSKLIAHLIDFDVACLATRIINRGEIGTQGYQAPEIYKKVENKPFYNLQSDNYSVGIILFEMMSNRNYYDYRSMKRDYASNLHQLGVYTHNDIYHAFEDIFEAKGKPQCLSYLMQIAEHFTHKNPSLRPDYQKIDIYCKNLRKIVSEQKSSNTLIAKMSNLTLETEHDVKPIVIPFDELSTYNRPISHLTSSATSTATTTTTSTTSVTLNTSTSSVDMAAIVENDKDTKRKKSWSFQLPIHQITRFGSGKNSPIKRSPESKIQSDFYTSDPIMNPKVSPERNLIYGSEAEFKTSSENINNSPKQHLPELRAPLKYYIVSLPPDDFTFEKKELDLDTSSSGEDTKRKKTNVSL